MPILRNGWNISTKSWIKEFIKQPVRQLSLGQRMKAELAAVSAQPQNRLFGRTDHWTWCGGQRKHPETIKEMNRKFNTTVILTTHDLNDIEELCNRILLIDQGKIIYDGDIRHLRKHTVPKIISFTLKDSGDIDVIDIKKPSNLSITIFLSKRPKTDYRGFNKHKLAIKEITSFVLNQVEVSDITFPTIRSKISSKKSTKGIVWFIMLKKYFPFFRASYSIFSFIAEESFFGSWWIFSALSWCFLWISVYKNNGSLNGFGLDEILLFFFNRYYSVFTYSEVNTKCPMKSGRGL